MNKKIGFGIQYIKAITCIAIITEVASAYFYFSNGLYSFLVVAITTVILFISVSILLIVDGLLEEIENIKEQPQEDKSEVKEK